MKQLRLKDRIPEERKYVIYKYDLNALIKVLFGVLTAFPDNPNAASYRYYPSQSLLNTSFCQLDVQGKTPKSSYLTINNSNSTNTTPIGNQTEDESWNDKTDTQLNSFLKNTEFASAELKHKNRSLSIELINLKVLHRFASPSRAKTMADANRAESKLDFFRVCHV